MSFFWKNCIRLFELYNEKNNFLIEIVEKALQNFDIMFILKKNNYKSIFVFWLIDIVFL